MAAGWSRWAGPSLNGVRACVTIETARALDGTAGDGTAASGTRISQRPSAAAALADVYRRVGVWLRARLVLRPVSFDACQRQDLHLGHHLRALPRRHRALFRAHDRDLA